jgi:pimeloyl-ACP methyl ester carboxylesterase
MTISSPTQQTLPPGARALVFETSAGTIAGWEAGDGARCVLLLHGNSSTKAIFRGQFDSELARDYRLVAFDLPGHGASDDAREPEKTYNIPGYARLMYELMALAQTSEPAVVGWSLGGHIAIEMLGQAMTRGKMALRGLALSGTPPAGPGIEEVGEAFRPSPHMQVSFKENPSKSELALYARMTCGKIGGQHNSLAQELLEAVYRCDGRSRRLTAEHWMTGAEGHPQRAVVANWPRPIAVIQGEKEPFFDNARLDDIAWGNLWENRVHILPDCGHAPFFEAPAAYNTLLKRFLATLW